MDTPRAEAKETLAQLKEAGIQKMIMLTGDNQKQPMPLQRKPGLRKLLGGLLPEQKWRRLRN